MKDFVQILKDDLEKGYSKSDLERLIGLPQNCLSGVIKGVKELSRKSEIKIEQWEVSEKPNPLQVYFVKKNVTENNLQEKKERILAERNGLPKEKAKQAYPLKTSEVNIKKHHLWKEGDPKEDSGSFFLRYGCFTYAELENLQK